jgi:hypothetical protein
LGFHSLTIEGMDSHDLTDAQLDEMQTQLLPALDYQPSTGQASQLSTATTSAVNAAMATPRAGSPCAIGATVVPTSMAMADVGPTANCRALPNAA